MPKGIKKAKPEEPVAKRNQVTKSTDVVWTPTPDMGDVKPPAEKEKACLLCGHKKATHYGSIKDWCNTQGCSCQGFK